MNGKKADLRLSCTPGPSSLITFIGLTVCWDPRMENVEDKHCILNYCRQPGSLEKII